MAEPPGEDTMSLDASLGRGRFLNSLVTFERAPPLLERAPTCEPRWRAPFLVPKRL